jgi:uncharacterized protein
MNKNAIARLATAIFFVFFGGQADAECLNTDSASDACRYPAGDAWCARHGDGNPYAYKDGCTKENDQTATPARPPAATGSWSPAPTWDCAKVRTGTERLICANPDIRAQDARMGALYARLQARGLAPERAQKAWLLDRRNACDSADCLRAVYGERISYLERLAGSEGAPVEERSFEIARVVRPPSAAPQTRTRPPEQAPDPVAESSPEPVALAYPVPTPDASPPRPETGIPELPPPEGPTLESRRRAEASGSTPYGEASRPPARGSGLLSASIAALALAIGLIVWRRRARIRAAVESSRPRLALLGQRMRTAPSAGLRGLSDLRARAQARVRHIATPSAGASDAPHPASMHLLDLHLSDRVVACMHELARPGESLSSVVARAVEALEAASEPPAPDPVQSRLAALEARLAQLEGTGEGTRT